MPTLLLALTRGAGKFLACEIMQQILFLGEGMSKMPEERCEKEEKGKYALRGRTGEYVIKRTSQGRKYVLLTHKYACGKWERNKMAVLIMPEADTPISDMAHKSEVRDRILSIASEES